jgi:SpoIIAA-like
MIEILSGLPDNIVGVRAKGRVTKKDYDEILVPKVEDAFGRHPKLRCLYEIGPEFSGMDPGAVWEDLKVGFGHLTGWERIAVVTDVEWIRQAINVFRFLVPGKTRLFDAAQAAEARRWIEGA